jgi:capsular polysaccharide export protein
MDGGKLKRLWPRTLSEIEMPGGRPVRRLGSEPVSRRVGHADRWDEGFLRLPGARTLRPLSSIVDGLGIYYDATAASELETMLQEGGWESEEILARAETGIRLLREARLSLDNAPQRADLRAVLGPRTHPLVVLVDQAPKDPTIGFGLASEKAFTTMLAAAAAEHPDAERVVIMDPAAKPGTEGHLTVSAIEAAGARAVTQPIEAWSAIEAADHVYAVTSHLGFEAALAGRPVACFGVPFYAGWGFTDDRLDPIRRTRSRSPAEVFAAVYLICSRYFEPYGGETCRFEEAATILRLIVEEERANAGRTLCVGFSAWKRRWLTQALSAPGHVPTIAKPKHAPKAAEIARYERVVAWASRAPEGLAAACRQAGVPLLRMEDGFIRSIGLGVALRPGASHVLDATGIYYDASGPSDLETLLEAGGFPEDVLDRARRLRAAIVEAGLSKYNVGTEPMPPMPRPGRVVLVAGQVENDASIRLCGATVVGNAGLLRRARERHPDAVIAFKPHPDVEAGLRPGRVPAEALAGLADVVLRDVSAADALAAADHVETISSLIGFEALLRGKSVTTHGLPFYAGWGLTQSPSCPRRTRRITLDELVAAALIVYPHYVDPRSGLPCPPEVIIQRLSEGDAALSRREPTVEAAMKQVWSLASRHLLRRK